MQAILHIGDMKCGSKSIQHWLCQDAAMLAEHGFHGCAATRVEIYDSRLASYALGDDRADTEPRRECGIATAAEVPAHRAEIEESLRRELVSLPATARAVVFSHEMLLSLEPDEVERVVSLLQRHFTSIRVVAYIRRQDQLFLSLWGQRLKTCDPGPAFCDCLRDTRSYVDMIDTWERAVGSGNMALRIFDKSAFRNGDLQADFCSAAGIPLDPRYTRPPICNEGLDSAAQSLLLELRDRLVARRERARRGIADRLRRLVRGRRPTPWTPITFPIPLVSHLMKYRTGRGLVPSRAWARHIVTACATENEIIRSRYFPNQNTLFHDDFSGYPEEGGPPGIAAQQCDPMAVRQDGCPPPEPEHVEQAYRLVLNRRPQPKELAQACKPGVNIAEVYATLLSRSRAA